MWTGTSDFTYKKNGLISSKSATLDDTNSVQNLQDTFLELRDFCLGGGGVKMYKLSF